MTEKTQKRQAVGSTKQKEVAKPAEQAERIEQAEQGKSAEQKEQGRSTRFGTFNFDSKWLIILVVLIAVITTTIYMNTNHTNNGTNKIASTIDTDNGDQKINWDKYPTSEVELDGSLEITKSGTYHLTGSVDGGVVTIRAGSEGVVRLQLDNVSITNYSGPAIACYSANDLVIELIGENNITDGSAYGKDYDEDVTGAIYSKADLTFQGDGVLNVTANYQDGVVGKDDVKFNSGTYKIIASDDGIRGKDSVYVMSGDFNITAGADAIKSTNETDTNKGFVMIDGGNFNLTTGAKGVKAINSILIYGGDFAINSTDDAVHSNNYVGITDGTLNISSSDDGIHADRELIVEGGVISVAKAYEGLEAQAVTINGGKISLTTSDDGINAGGGADSSAAYRAGAGTFNADENCTLVIGGGEVYVNASGDGIDSNGWLYFNGGKVVVDGPTNNGNGALDSGMGIVMNGGTVIAVGSSGMAETLGASSSVYNASVYFGATQATGTLIEVKNAAGDTILTHTTAKIFNHMAMGAESFKLGETYTIYLNGEKYQSFTISDIVTTVGNSNTNQMMAPGQGQNQGGAPAQAPNQQRR